MYLFHIILNHHQYLEFLSFLTQITLSNVCHELSDINMSIFYQQKKILFLIQEEEKII